MSVALQSQPDLDPLGGLGASARDPLPTLSAQDSTLLGRLLKLDADILALARDTGRDQFDLACWATSPQIRPYLAVHEQLAAHSRRVRIERWRHQALSALAATLEATTDLIEKR